MGDEVVLPGVEHGVIGLQALSHVVGVQHRNLRGLLEPVGTHQPDVRPRDRQDAGRAPRRRRDRPRPCRRTGGRLQRVVRQERAQVRAYRDRTDTRAATAVRDAERLVQVEVRDVGAERTRLGDADERVHVGAVDVDLSARVVHEATDLADGLLVHAVRGRVRDHQRRQLVVVLTDLRLQIIEIDIAALVARHHDDAHASHDSARRVGAVGGDRDQADVAMVVTTAAVVRADRQQARELALRAGVRLQRHGVVARDRHEPALELVDQQQVAVGLIQRCERMNRRELRPRDGLHLRCRVQLHRARAQRNHRAVERDVLARQPSQVPQHLRLRVVLMEDRMLKNRVRAQKVLREAVGRLRVEYVGVGVDAEDLPERLEVLATRHLVERDAHDIAIDTTQVDAELACLRDHDVGVVRHAHLHRVEERVVEDMQSATA